MTRYFPAFLDLRGRACLVVGAGEEVERKAHALREAGAVVTLAATAEKIEGTYTLAVVATGELERDEAIARRLSGCAALINVVDRPSLCSFIWPAVVERGPVTIAISTAGSSPTLATLIRQRIERVVPAAVGELARLAGQLRRQVAAVAPTVAKRRRFWRRALEGRAGTLAFSGRAAAAQAALQAEVKALGVSAAAKRR
jgi:uroporphyrin-III C-methyltransferase/precorrin-2 dehydrogenase/sirohydrochlorin ferrochelatase